MHRSSLVWCHCDAPSPRRTQFHLSGPWAVLLPLSLAHARQATRDPSQRLFVLAHHLVHHRHFHLARTQHRRSTQATPSRGRLDQVQHLQPEVGKHTSRRINSFKDGSPKHCVWYLQLAINIPDCHGLRFIFSQYCDAVWLTSILCVQQTLSN